ncbi:phytosulfokines 3 [Helianthus annuus]|uniref:Phytosulfokine n=1 Tax=Helianthus annuus TaxID=4232 RepID=A0A251T6X7_HELAN|nr:phytosulfokines 3 [Helianthus annuus]
MSRATTLFLMLSLLLLSPLLSLARPEPATTTTTRTPSKGVEVEEVCEGIGEEECLMRRTLVAHLDYIYTQKKNP